MKKKVTSKALANYIKKHPEDFEAVDTRYRSKNGEKPVRGWIYHGHKKHACIHCGGTLEEKVVSIKEEDEKLKGVNSFYKEVGDIENSWYLSGHAADLYGPGVLYDEVAAAAWELGVGVIEYPDQQFDHCEIWR